MELERVKYLLKCYLRTRLFKIEKFILYIVEHDKANLLSEGELTYAWKLYESKKNYLNQAFFSKVPSKLNVFETDEFDPRLSKFC